MGIVLKQGRFFQEHSEADKKTVIVNETLVANLDLEDPLGQVFKIGDDNYRIVGVVRDFHAYNFYSRIKPTIFRVAEPENYRFLSLRVKAGSEVETYEKMQDEWAELFPEIPFDGGHQEDVWGSFAVSVKDGDKFWTALASIVVAIASLGLYGLVTLNVSGRTREFSIRKVLGAGMKNIFSNITRQYILVFATVLMLAAPVSYYLVDLIFETFFVYPMPLDYSFFALSGGILILVVLVVVFTQMKRLSRSSPVEGLKIE